MHDHIIVSGDDALAATIIGELKRAGSRVVKLNSAEIAEGGVARELARADVARAVAVVCAGDDDALNLEIALLARRASQNARVVARLTNDVLRAAVADDNGPGAIFNVAELAAPAIVEACLSHTAHPFEAAGLKFVATGSDAPRDGSLREIYGEMAPVAIIHGENSPTPGEVVACPTRDERVHAGDWTVVIGTADEAAARGVKVRRPTGTRTRRRRLRRAFDAIRAVLDDFNPAFYPALGATGMLVAASVLVLHYNYRRPRMSWIDALYFTVETITTTGYGDFSFAQQTTWLRLFAASLMFGGAITIALLVAFIADVLLSQRFVLDAARPRVRHLRNHIIVVGLSELGIRVVADLVNAGHDVAVIERDEENRFLPTAKELDVPVIFGDATFPQTLESARVDRARAVAVVTRDDMINIETGIILSEILGPRVLPAINRLAEVPLVLRVFERKLGFAVAQRFGFDSVRSTIELAAPWFIGAASGLKVLGTFSVGQSSFMVGAMRVAPRSELDGLLMADLSTQVRVIAFTREDEQVQVRPRRDDRLEARDIVYLVGPYRELLATLRRALPPRQPANGEDAPRGGRAQPDTDAADLDVKGEARAG
ncbi:potassium channel family protein [Candidatus Mycobacterium methanotrophicum]|uniref:NAD-binding protein n=1 Tax=Candidatus Mycobacterium methanotrophicum TaxID=2943498 RepID=A0ABY4QL98_9MYCO|nr:NAD-binding protein [Candidatus Mycobacterium methanotrophicum]UQX11267.1 NAD-binding protein [Candidatus Mycobacterium methanotrophicum]